MKTLRRRTLLAAVSTLLAAGAHAQEPVFPTGTVTIVVPFAAGGSSDAIARALAPALARKWGKTVLIENRSGANTIVAASHVLNSPPDGHTIFYASYAWVTNQFLAPSLPYAPGAMAPVTLLGRYPLLLYVRNSLPVNSVEEFVAYGKKPGNRITFAHAGAGSSTHLASAGFANASGLDVTFVPYRGTAPAMQDLVGGQVDALFEGLTYRSFADDKRVKALFVGQPDKLADWPALPTARDVGLGDYSMGSWFGLMVPARTPPAIRARLSADIGAVIREPEIDAQLRKVGLIPQPTNPAEFAAFLEAERVKLKGVIERNRITAD